MKKSKIRISDFESQGGIKKLEAEGHRREEISKAMYKLTDGMSSTERRHVIGKFYDRTGRTGMSIREQRRRMANLMDRR